MGAVRMKACQLLRRKTPLMSFEQSNVDVMQERVQQRTVEQIADEQDVEMQLVRFHAPPQAVLVDEYVELALVDEYLLWTKQHPRL